MEAFYSNKTSFLTKKGFVIGSKLNDGDEIGYFDLKGKLVFTKDYTCIKEARTLDLLSCGNSYIVCNKELKPYISSVHTLNNQKESNQKCNLVIDGEEYTVTDKEYLTLCFLFLNYASYNPKKSEIVYDPKKNHYSSNVTFYNTLSLFYKQGSLRSEQPIKFHYDSNDRITTFKCLGLLNKESEFIYRLLNSIDSSKYFLKYLRICGLVYNYDLNYFYLNCNSRNVSLVLLFLITLTGCYGSIKEKEYIDKKGNKKNNDIIYFFKSNDKTTRVCGPTYLLPSIGIKLGDNIPGTLITASTYKDHTSITFAPSYTEN